MTTPINRIKLLAIFLFISFVISSNVKAADEVDTAISNGKLEFIESCSLCHGDDAKGHGVFSEMLIIPTADLTQLKSNNNGYFPYKSVYSIVDGRDHVKQHGPRYMPIWGNRFNTTTWADVNQEYSETLVRGKIFELLLYLESIQE